MSKVTDSIYRGMLKKASLPPEMVERIVVYAMSRGDKKLLQEAIMSPSLPRHLDEKFASSPDPKVLAAWLKRPERRADEVVDFIKGEKRVNVLTDLASVLLPAEAYPPLLEKSSIRIAKKILGVSGVSLPDRLAAAKLWGKLYKPTIKLSQDFDKARYATEDLLGADIRLYEAALEECANVNALKVLVSCKPLSAETVTRTFTLIEKLDPKGTSHDRMWLRRVPFIPKEFRKFAHARGYEIMPSQNKHVAPDVWVQKDFKRLLNSNGSYYSSALFKYFEAGLFWEEASLSGQYYSYAGSRATAVKEIQDEPAEVAALKLSFCPRWLSDEVLDASVDPAKVLEKLVDIASKQTTNGIMSKKRSILTYAVSSRYASAEVMLKLPVDILTSARLSPAAYEAISNKMLESFGQAPEGWEIFESLTDTHEGDLGSLLDVSSAL